MSYLSLALQMLQQKVVKQVQADVEELVALMRASHVYTTIHHWLKATDATINYNDAAKKRHPDTGLWFVGSATFTAWPVRPNSLLWLNGFAGSGKSVLCSTAITHLPAPKV